MIGTVLGVLVAISGEVTNGILIMILAELIDIRRK